MSNLHPLAQELNSTIQKQHPSLFDLLSERGKKIFFPFGGILGQTAAAKGKKYNATIGIALENDGTPMRLPSMDAHIDLDPKDVYPYASSFGKQELREKWREMLYIKNPSLRAEVSMPVVANGLTHALSVVVYTLLDAGQTMLLPSLYWGNYNLMFSHVYGVEFQTFNTFKDDTFDVEAFRESLSQGTGKKIVLLNFPNNPAGYTPTKEEVEQIVSALKERAEAGDTLAVILDDAYFGLVYEEGLYAESLFSLLADLHERIIAIKVDGATKEDYAWGHRVGFVTFASKGMTADVQEAYEAKLAGVVRATLSNVPHLSQSLLVSAYQEQQYGNEKDEKYAVLKERYLKVKEILSDPKFADVFRPLPFNSGYFMCVELVDGLDAEEIRKKLLEEYSTGVVAIGNKFRIAYSSLPTEHIAPFFENLFLACSSSFSSHESTNEHSSQPQPA
jgi:aspartate/methionine/tyrosine aminotransferase